METDNWTGLACNYVVAGGDCFVSLMGNFIDKHDKSDCFDDAKINNFAHHNVNKFLYSFGTGLNYKTKRMSPKHTEKIIRVIDFINDRPMMKDTKLYIDSGGFQVAMGAVEPKDMPSYIEKYHTFLLENHHKYNYAFHLDLPPGPASSVFESYSQLEELNRVSYRATANLPQEVKDKMIYIHHFRTPSIYDTWSKFLWEEHLADGFKNFATGGLVANMATDMIIPIIIYSIPLSEILKYAISKNMTEFNFHVLGGANFIDVFYHKLFSYHILKTHGVKVNITYDSSAIFKALAIGRFIPVMKDDGNLTKMDLKSNSLHLRFENMMTCEDKVYQLLNEIADQYNLKRLTPETDPIYDTSRDTFSRSVHMYLILYYLKTYRQLETMCEKFVEEIYPLYEQDKQEEFDEKCYELAKKFNQGKNTKKQKAKIASIAKSLEVLTKMDRSYNRHLIHKFMSNDDISEMNNSSVIKFS
jgi:hypothetical protein